MAHHVPARSMLYSNNRVMLQNSPLLVTDVEFTKQIVGNLGTTELEVTLRQHMENAQIGSEQKVPQAAGGLRFMKSQSQSKLIKDKQIIAAAPPVMCGESEHSLRISQIVS